MQVLYDGKCVHLSKAKRYSKHFSFPLFLPSFLGTDFIENVYIASRSRKEPKCPQASEVPEHRPQVNSITVSKKRSWLQQSTHRRPPPPLEGENAWKEEHGAVIPVPRSPVPLPEPAVPWAPSTVAAGREQPARSCALRSAAPDCAEDGDADDEGEIWYNPIPEDDEPDLPGVPPSAVNSLVTVGSPSVRYKGHPGGDSGVATSPQEGPTRSAEGTGSGWTAQPGEGSPADAAPPGEHTQQHRHRLACKAPGVPTAEDNPAFKCPSTGKSVQELKCLSFRGIINLCYVSLFSFSTSDVIKQIFWWKCMSSALKSDSGFEIDAC